MRGVSDVSLVQIVALVRPAHLICADLRAVWLPLRDLLVRRPDGEGEEYVIEMAGAASSAAFHVLPILRRGARDTHCPSFRRRGHRRELRKEPS